MAKVKGPVFSTKATKSIAGTVTYQKKHRVTSAHLKTYPGAVVPTVKTWRQRDQGNIIALLITRWQTMTDVERAHWNTLARTQRLNMSGYHLWLQTAQKDLLAHYGLAAYWSMNGVLGGITPDISRNGNDGTLMPNWPANAPAHIPGTQPGEAWLDFDGADDCVEVPAMNINIPSITVELWGKSATENWNTSGWLASSRGASGFITHPDSGTRRWRGFIHDSAGNHHLIGLHTPTDITVWHHYAITFDDSAKIARIFFDGESVAETTLTITRGVWNRHLLIGKDDAPGGFGHGLIDEARVYNRALSAEEIRRHYLREKERH